MLLLLLLSIQNEREEYANTNAWQYEYVLQIADMHSRYCKNLQFQFRQYFILRMIASRNKTQRY